jgi:hypothetical protein
MSSDYLALSLIERAMRSCVNPLRCVAIMLAPWQLVPVRGIRVAVNAVEVRNMALRFVAVVGLLAVLRLRGPIWALAVLALYAAIRLLLRVWQRRRDDWRPPRR